MSLPPSFSAEIMDVKLLYNILKAISFQQLAIVRPMEEGLKITIEDTKSSEVSIYLPASSFAAYHAANDIEFKLNLKNLTECLHIYGEESTSSLKLSYEGHGSPLCLTLKHSEDNIIVNCQLTCLDVDNFREIALAEECNVNKVVFNGEQFVDILSDLDMSADEFELQIDSKPPYFRISTSGILGESVLDIPKLSEIVTIFACTATFSSRYPFNNLKQILKVMSYASKISVSTGESGLLGLQLILYSGEKQLFVEYYMTSLC